MKVIPSNQTLILASERGISGGPSALRTVTGEAALRRVTIVASRPDDSLVYVQADYASPQESSDIVDEFAGTASTALPAPPPTALPARLSLSSSRGGPYSSSRGAALYSSTQRILSDTPSAQIDVHA